MSDFTYDELDDIDSAITDSQTLLDDQEGLDRIDVAYRKRLDELTVKVRRLMLERPRESMARLVEP